MSEFIYPFNFVVDGGRPRPEGRVGGYRCYQPLDRYEGRSGRIEFTLTNLSPLFIPDPEQTTYYRVGQSEDSKPQHHRVMDFFDVDGRLAIPGTALKGMIRSVAEALSNSSFGVFTPPEEKFTFRKTMDLGRGVRDLRDRKWGRWTATGEVEPLKAAKIWRDTFDRALGLGNDEQQRERLYNSIRESQVWVRAELWQLHTGACHVRDFNGTYNGVPLAGTVFANIVVRTGRGWLQQRPNDRVGKGEIEVTPGDKIKGPLLADVQNALGLPRAARWQVDFETVTNVPNAMRGRPEERVCRIWKLDRRGTRVGNPWEACRNPCNVMLWPRSRWTDIENPNSHYIAALYPSGAASLPVTEALRYFKKANPKCELPSPGDIVRYLEDNGKVIEFGPVAMFKTPEQATVQELAEAETPHLLPRRTNTSLCPVSRLFGWTPEGGEDAASEEKFPVAGRVRVGIAWSDKTLADTRLIPLQILGSPKPQYYPFYLRPAQDSVAQQTGSADSSSMSAALTRAGVTPSSSDIDYEEAVQETGYYASRAGGWWHRAGRLRGRKFYLHHPDTLLDPSRPAGLACAPPDAQAACDNVAIRKEMVSKEVAAKAEDQLNDQDLRTHQNATAAVLPPGVTFTGYVEFDSLSDYELGLLLWAISLSDLPLEGCAQRAHKLGMGRPIGMGSVRVQIDRITLCDPVEGWRETEEPAETPVDREEAIRLVKAFKTWMLTGNETPDDDQVNRFDQRVFYRELCEVLSLDLVGEGPVQYHKPGTLAYEGYTYFVEQRQKRNTHGEEPLRTPIALRNRERQGT